MRHLLLVAAMKKSAKTNSSEGPPVKKGHWTAGLLHSMQDPQLKIFEDDQVVVIKDKYPKAKFHYLVLPKENIPSITHVTKDNNSLLEHLEKVGENISKKHIDHEFIIGYHAIPSMQRLHLHVISTDFISPCLKTKYHWNSFTTPFFIPSYKIRNQLQREGQINLNAEANKIYLKTDLKCYNCSKPMKSMAELKKHLLQHTPNDKE